MIRILQRIALSFFVLTGWCVQAQISTERQLETKIEKGQWAKAEQLLRKALKKDSLNTESWYLLSKLYFTTGFSKFNIDSAHQFVLTSQRIYSVSTPRQKERLKKLPLDSVTFIIQNSKIDSAAFERAKQVNSEESYLEFLERFPKAQQKKVAIELRDEVAFVKALKINTYASFQQYLNKYPQSLRAGDAKARYEKLLFEDKTKDGKLKSYQTFLANYPTTPYRREAEQNIYEITTALGSPETLINFIKNNPDNLFRKQAINILYHLPHQDEHPFEFFTDSLRQVALLERGYLVPVLKDHQYGFITEIGNELIAPQFSSISGEYICGDIRTDYLIVEGGIIGRNGKWIYRGQVEDAEDMGLGFLRVGVEDSMHVIHKSGFRITPNEVEDAKIIAENFIALKKNETWSLVSFAGKPLIAGYENIETMDSIVILTRKGKKIITTAERLAVVADKNSFSESLVFDDVRLLERGTYLVKNGSLEGAIHANLEYVIPLDRQLLSKAPSGFISEQNKKFLVKGVSSLLEGKEYEQVKFYGNWISLFSRYNKQLFDLPTKQIIADELDSIWFTNRIAFTLKNDSLKAYLLSGKSMSFPSNEAIFFISSPDSIHYLYTLEKKKKVVFDISTGTRLFDVEADGIEYLGHQIFLITKKDSKGLVGVNGKVVLPLEYAAIVPSGNRFVSLLKDKKFGFFDLEKKILIKPDYARNITPFSDQLLIAFKDGFYGFINWESQPKTNFEFEEIRNWNDTTALVKKNFSWSVYSIPHQNAVLHEIKDFTEIAETEEEKLLVVFQDNHYGVLSNTRGIILPSNFSSIVNVGSAEIPFYFAEKHVEEAGIFIVIYYDQNGKLIRREVYEEEEYDKISCEDN